MNLQVMKSLFAPFFVALSLSAVAQTAISYKELKNRDDKLLFENPTFVSGLMNQKTVQILHHRLSGSMQFLEEEGALLLTNQHLASSYLVSHAIEPTSVYTLRIQAAATSEGNTPPILEILTTCLALGETQIQQIDSEATTSLQVLSKCYKEYIFYIRTQKTREGFIVSLKPNQEAGSIKIQRILIEKQETRKAFTLMPAVLDLPSNAAVAQSFQVVSTTEKKDAHYVWRLGRQPNGWLLPDGSMAPEILNTGSENTLVLFPAQGMKQSDVQADVTTGGKTLDAGFCKIIRQEMSQEAETASARFAENPWSFSVFPNPAKDEVQVYSSQSGDGQWAGFTQLALVQLATGKLQLSRHWEQPIRNCAFNLSAVPEGHYLLQLSDGVTTAYKRLVVLK